MKYRKKPVVIEAVQWIGTNVVPMAEFIGTIKGMFVGAPIIIHTLEGDHTANVGDWIIKGVKGEFYPCRADIFEATYEKVEGIPDGASEVIPLLE